MHLVAAAKNCIVLNVSKAQDMLIAGLVFGIEGMNDGGCIGPLRICRGETRGKQKSEKEGRCCPKMHGYLKVRVTRTGPIPSYCSDYRASVPGHTPGL